MTTVTAPSVVDRIQALASMFPCLRRRPEVINWNPIALDRWARVASHGEKVAVQFVLRVWNCHQNWECGRFDAVEAYQVWDAPSWSAFQLWAKKPFTL